MTSKQHRFKVFIYICLLLGSLTCLNIVFFAITGMSFIAPLQDNQEARALAIAVVHLAGVVLGLVGLRFWFEQE